MNTTQTAILSNIDDSSTVRTSCVVAVQDNGGRFARLSFGNSYSIVLDAAGLIELQELIENGLESFGFRD